MKKSCRMDFCTECRKETAYEVRKITSKETIREKEYDIQFTAAFCKECGAEMDIPGLLDLNIKERDRQFREAEGIITVDEIKKLMELYHIGKAPLSLALGFGEVTVARYLEGQVPSKSYSDIMRTALAFPEYMEALLRENRDKVGDTAYRKAQKAISSLKELFQVSNKMLIAIAYVFEQMEEVTPLALQKILYFIQGIHMALYGKPMYTEDCEAWVHGPVYPKVYNLFRDFKYNPIEDHRFAIFYGRSKELNADEKNVIDLVVRTFGTYSGKTLERITHREKPWVDARDGYGEVDAAEVVIPQDDMSAYFAGVAEQYKLDTEEGLNLYIDSKLG